MRHGIIDDQRKTPSGLRKQLQSAGFANAETLVHQQGVGRVVTYAFCEMHNKCTTDILRNTSQIRKTARKTGGSASKVASHRHANAVAKTTLQTTTKLPRKLPRKSRSVPPLGKCWTY